MSDPYDGEPIDLDKAEALLRTDARFDVQRQYPECVTAFGTDEYVDIDVHHNSVVIGLARPSSNAPGWAVEWRLRILNECRKFSRAGMRRLGLAFHAWAAAMAVENRIRTLLNEHSEACDEADENAVRRAARCALPQRKA